MGCIYIEGLVERECRRIVVQCCISGRLVHGNGSMSESRNEFLDVANAKATSERGAKGVTVPRIA